MAAVMITKDLLRMVQHRIETIAAAEVREECPDLEKSYAIDVADLYHKITWAENLHLLDVLPQEWLRPIDAPVIRTVEEGGLVAVVQFTGVAAFERPSRPSGYYRSTIEPTTTIEWLWENSALPGAKELIQRHADAKKAKEIQEKYKEISEKVTAFLQRCKSLNEAVKLMPSLKMYVSKDHIERMERKVDRQTAADLRAQELLKGIDQDQLMAVGMAAKIQGHIK